MDFIVPPGVLGIPAITVPPLNFFTGQVAIAGATLIRAANAGRHGIVIKNLATSAGTLWVGNAGVTAADGYELPPGQSITLEYPGDLYGIDSGGAVTANFAEEVA